MVIPAVERRLAWSRAAVHGDLNRGLTSLASISSTAPLLGILGTARGIIGSFRGTVGSRSSALGYLAYNLADALVFTVLSLAVALLALAAYKYLVSQMETFDFEMEDASRQLVACLIRAH